MLVGDPSRFALEFGITNAYERLSLRALGYFVIHINGHSFGRNKPNATMLACSFDEVGRRIAGHSAHVAPFSQETAAEIADAFRNAVYADQQRESYFGIPLEEFASMWTRGDNPVWAPDGDEAFDDGSYVLQFGVGEQVRLIGFKSTRDESYDAESLTEVLLPADEFYRILREWLDAFEKEWNDRPKTPEEQLAL
jgi:hypothetical protein